MSYARSPRGLASVRVRPSRRSRSRPRAVAAVPLWLAVVIAVATVGLLAPAAVPAQAAPAPAAARDRAPQIGPLLAPLAAGAKRPTTAGLTAALAPLIRDTTLGGRVSVSVRDVATGRQLYGHAPTTAFIPASTTKLLTASAALSLLGPDHRFSTRVVMDPLPRPAAKTRPPPVIVLIGGGDPLLSSQAALARARNRGHVLYPDATLATVDAMATSTATALKAGKHTEVTLRYDASRFTQPVSPHWGDVYIDSSVVAPVSALWIDQGRIKAPFAARVLDPAKDAATRFAVLLTERGITVSGAPVAAPAARGATAVAPIKSPPLASIVEHVLLTSDDDGAEVLARQAALAAGKAPNFAGATAAVLARVRSLGMITAGVRLYDGSGLSRDNRIPAASLTSLIDIVAVGGHPALSGVLSGLPVGGFDGSLLERFRVVGVSGAGYVHAKTGTLAGVTSLAGTVLTRDGALLSFAVLADRIGATSARPAVDRIAATLAGCGCRSGPG